MPVSYTHLDVYKRQIYSYNAFHLLTDLFYPITEDQLKIIGLYHTEESVKSIKMCIRDRVRTELQKARVLAGFAGCRRLRRGGGVLFDGPQGGGGAG